MDKTKTERPGNTSFSRLAVGFGLVFSAALGSGIYFYQKYIAYDRVAAWHLPADVSFAARLDVEQVVLFEPVRKNLLPLLDRLSSRPDLPARRGRFKDLSGVVLGRDLRELVLACGVARGSCVLVVGGKFPGGLTGLLFQLLQQEGISAQLNLSRGYLTLPSGIALGQAADGVLIATPGPELWEQAALGQPHHAALGLLPNGPGSFVLLPAQAAGPDSLLSTLPGLSALIEQSISLKGELTLGNPTRLLARLTMPAPASAQVASAMLGAMLGPLGVSFAPFQHATRQVVGSEVELQVPWTNPELDLAAAALAAWLELWFART